LPDATGVIFHAEALTRKRVDHWRRRDSVIAGSDDLVTGMRRLFLFAAMVLAGGLNGSPAHAETLVEWPLETFEEPSAVVYHPPRKTLFVVGDQGDIAEIDLAGNILKVRAIGGDLEGIACDPATGNLYVVREGHEILLEVDPDSLKVSRRFMIDRTFEGNANFLERGSDGIEGVTFRPDSTHPEGGRFFAVNQFDPPVLVELAVPLKTSGEQFETATILSAQRVKSAPLSDVLWYPPVDGFLITSALWRSVYVTDSLGIRRRSVKMPGFVQEGIAVLPDGAIVIVQDTGGLLKWTPDGDPFVEADQTGVKAEEKNEKLEKPQ
jgi:hypothetical protein